MSCTVTKGQSHDLEQLVLTENLFDAASSELSIVARGQPCLIVGDFNEEPTKGISAGLWVGFEEAWALAAGLQPAPTCKRGWSASGGHRRNFMVGCPLAAAAAVLSCRVQPGRWTADHLAVRTLFECCRWTSRVTQPLSRTLLWPAFWLSAVEDAMRLDESLEAGGVSRAWPVWSGAAEAVLADAYRFIGVLFPAEVWFLGGRVLCLGLSVLVVIRCGRLVAMCLMRMMMLVSSCIVTLLLLRCLT